MSQTNGWRGVVLINRGLGNWVKYYKWGVRTNERAFFFLLIPMKNMYQNLPLYEQSYNLWKVKKVLKQYENKLFRFKNMTCNMKVEMKY